MIKLRTKEEDVTIISNLLIHYREYHQLTQQALAEKLAAYSSDFQNLNTVTISRWETGTTTPSIHKKKLLLHFFATSRCLTLPGVCKELVHKAYEALYEPLSGVFTRNYQYLIGNFPEFVIDHSNIHTLTAFRNKREHYEHIVDIEIATNVPNYYTLTSQTLEHLSSFPSSFTIICERKKQHLGHFVMFKIKNSVAEEIVTHKRGEHTVTMEDLCRTDEPGTYYVHALYGKNPKIAAILNVYAYIHLFEHMKTIDKVLIFSSRKDGMLLTKDYGIELIAKGYDETLGYTWHGLMSPVEDILFSDTVVKLVF